MNELVAGLARFLLSCWLLCQGANLVASPQYYLAAYEKMLKPTGFADGMTVKWIEWYGHILFVLGGTLLLKFRVARYLAMLLLLAETVLTVATLPATDPYHTQSLVPPATIKVSQEHLLIWYAWGDSEAVTCCGSIPQVIANARI